MCVSLNLADAGALQVSKLRSRPMLSHHAPRQHCTGRCFGVPEGAILGA